MRRLKECKLEGNMKSMMSLQLFVKSFPLSENPHMSETLKGNLILGDSCPVRRKRKGVSSSNAPKYNCERFRKWDRKGAVSNPHNSNKLGTPGGISVKIFRGLGHRT